MKTSINFRKVYGSPSVLAAITAVGLILALFGDGMWDAISWVALAIPLSVIAWKLAVGRLRPS